MPRPESEFHSQIHFLPVIPVIIHIHLAKPFACASMGCNQTALKRAINVRLSEDLIREAQLYTRDLSFTLEALLGDFVAREHERHRQADAALDRVIDALGEFHTEHGLLSDEFPTV